MTKTELIARLDALKNDAHYWIDDDNIVHIYFNDFDGFDDDWDEIDRDYDDPSAVESLLDDLENSCKSVHHDFYTLYHFDGFGVKVGFESYDI